MTFRKLRELTLGLMFSGTVAGEEIPESYCNQADYTRLIAPLADDCQLNIAGSYLPIQAMTPLSTLTAESAAGGILISLPEDCMDIFHGGLFLPGEGELMPGRRWGGYRLLGGRLLLPADAPEGLILEYRRRPRPLGENPPDTAELDNSPEAQACVPYYVAAQLLLYDDPYRYSVLRAEFERRAARLRPPAYYEQTITADVYGFF